MDISKVTISCVKSDCLGRVSLHESRCGACHNPIVKRYLKVIHAPAGLLQPQTLFAERYWVTEFTDIVLDTQPQDKPILTEEIPPEIESYLKLSIHLLHIPKVYGLLSAEGGWLLEYPSVTLAPSGLPLYPDLFVSLLEAWQTAQPLQQLNWLAQMAGLLPDFLKQGAAGTFYDLSLLGINGGVVQVRQLLLDRQQNIDFKKLGQVWKELLEHSDKSIKGFCQKLHQGLIQGKIQQPEVLCAVLDAGILELGRSQYDYQYRLYTQTHAGPTRKHNEDACFPPPGKLYQNSPLAIVCDGIGGHDKGEVASAIAIETLQQSVASIAANNTAATPEMLRNQLSEATLRANDAISDQNDEEQRTERERMGTTLVMAWARTPDLYLTHVGDSRIYRITPESCHQVTFDDDLGSREVRLGYALYQDALQYPAAGALVQALGMSPSHALYPTVKRLIPDQDVIYLLCSDGLSDYGRVEGHWQREIAPLIAGEKDLPNVVERLIDIANNENGHDNATIALLHIRVKWRETGTAIAFPDLEQLAAQQIPATAEITESAAPVTQVSPPIRRSPNQLILFVVGLICATGMGWLLWSMWQRSQTNDIAPETIRPQIVTSPPISDVPPETPAIAIPDTTPDAAPDAAPSPLNTNQILRLKANAVLVGYDTSAAIATPNAPTVKIPAGSTLKVKQIDGDRVMVQLCQAGSTPTVSTTAKILTKGNNTWLTLDKVVQNMVQNMEQSFAVTSDESCN